MNKTKIIDTILSSMLAIALMLCVNLVVKKIDTENEIISVIGENRLRPIYNVETEENKIALTFNAVWGGENTYEILDVLDKYNVKATFFVTGYWANDYEDELIEIQRRGHEIGNHTKNHTHGTELSYEKNIDEIVKVHEDIKNILGIDMNLYRPPFGEYNNTVIASAEDLGYYPILWSIDSNDWMEKGVDYETKTVLENSNLKNGAIILFHIGSKYTVQSLENVLESLTENFEVVKVSDLIFKENYHINDKGIQIKD